MPMKMIENKDELVSKYVKTVNQSLQDGKGIPPLPKGLDINDLPPATRALVKLQKGDSGEFTEIIKA